MNQLINSHERIQRFFEKKAIAIPLRTIRFIFTFYFAVCTVAFTIIIIYPGDFLKDSFQPHHISPPIGYPAQLRNHVPPIQPPAPDSLDNLSKHLK